MLRLATLRQFLLDATAVVPFVTKVLLIIKLEFVAKIVIETVDQIGVDDILAQIALCEQITFFVVVLKEHLVLHRGTIFHWVAHKTIS